MPVILKSISLPHLRLFSDLIPLAFSTKNQNFTQPASPTFRRAPPAFFHLPRVLLQVPGI